MRLALSPTTAATTTIIANDCKNMAEIDGYHRRPLAASRPTVRPMATNEVNNTILLLLLLLLTLLPIFSIAITYRCKTATATARSASASASASLVQAPCYLTRCLWLLLFVYLNR